MLNWLLRKILHGILVMMGITVLLTTLFFSFLSGDGNAAYEMTGQNTSRETIEKIKKEYALDAPVWMQVAYYMNDLSPISLHENTDSEKLHFLDEKYSFLKITECGHYTLVLKKPYLRRSYQTNREVASVIRSVLPATLILALASMLFASLVGILLGIICALNKDRWIDKAGITLATIGVSAPSFFAAVLISWIFGYVLHQYTGLPTWGNFYVTDDFTGEVQIRFLNLILPAFTLGLRPLSVIVQLTRNSMLHTLAQDYIRTARAKGLSPTKILLRHALRNSLNPVITAISGWLGGLLAGAVFIEYIFGWKGIGKEIVDGLQRLDYPVVMGAVITVAGLFVIINFAVDACYVIADPRTKSKT